LDFTYKNALVSAQNTLTVADRLRHLMKEHGLCRSGLASILRTAPRTLDHWLDGDAEPPGVLSAVVDLLAGCSCARRALGVNVRHARAPRGRPFTKGNPWRSTDARSEEMLRRVRAI
jgi:hypothetical protein